MANVFGRGVGLVVATMLVSGSAMALARRDDVQTDRSLTTPAPATPPRPAATLTPSLPIPVVPQASRVSPTEKSAAANPADSAAKARRTNTVDATDPWTGERLPPVGGVRA